MARLFIPVVAALALAPLAAQAQAQLPMPQQQQAPAVALNCQLDPRPFGPGVAKVTNISSVTIPAGRVISVIIVQAGSGGTSRVLSAPLGPGQSVDVPLTGASLLARGCSALAG
jgi:hypothetical protein